VFWVNVPVGVLAIIMFALFLPERVERRQHRLDYLGGVLLIVGIGALMLALVQARDLGAAGVAGLAALGVAAMALLFLHERQIAEPMLPFPMWRRRVVALCNVAGFGASAAMMAVSALLPTYVQGVMGKSPSVAGVVIAAQSVSWMFAAFAAGRLMIRTSYRLTAAIGGLALVVGAAMLVVLEPDSAPLWPAAAGFVMGIGMGFCNTTFLVAIQATVAWHERGVGTGSQMFMRMIGQAVGAAAYGAIINFGVQQRLPGAAGAVNRLIDPAQRATLGADLAARLGEAVGWAAHHAFVLALAIALATLAATVGLPKGLSPVRSPPR
jgi:predicted MFS family arabinose efflux permease